MQYRVCSSQTCAHRFKVHVQWVRTDNMLTVTWTIIDDDVPATG